VGPGCVIVGRAPVAPAAIPAGFLLIVEAAQVFAWHAEAGDVK
jgi:hypothetical protein